MSDNDEVLFCHQLTGRVLALTRAPSGDIGVPHPSNRRGAETIATLYRLARTGEKWEREGLCCQVADMVLHQADGFLAVTMRQV